MSYESDVDRRTSGRGKRADLVSRRQIRDARRAQCERTAAARIGDMLRLDPVQLARDQENAATAKRMGCPPVSREELAEALVLHAARQQAATIRAARAARRPAKLTRGAPIRTLVALWHEIRNRPSLWFMRKPMPRAFVSGMPLRVVARYVEAGMLYRCNRPKAAK